MLACLLCAVFITRHLTPLYSNGLHSQGVSQKYFLYQCRYIYIDMGTNIGVQIRKLYEPHLYRGAPVLPLFQEMFGNHSSEVCSVGFEANPLHDKYLKEFEAYSLRRGWRVKIFTSTAVSFRDGLVSFFTEPGNEVNNQWTASLEPTLNTSNTTVTSIDIASWIKDHILSRNSKSRLPKPIIMMKSDIERHDPTVLAHLMLSGVYCSIDMIYAEHLTKEFSSAVSLIQNYARTCKTKLIDMDDESYYQQRFPFVLPN